MSSTTPQVISWPLSGVNGEGQLIHANDHDSVGQVIMNILLTRPGERLMRPSFGAGLLDFVHEPNNQTTRSLMANVITKAINQWETRITLDSVQVQPDASNLSAVHIIIRYQLLFSGVPNELSFNLQLESGG